MKSRPLQAIPAKAPASSVDRTSATLVCPPEHPLRKGKVFVGGKDRESLWAELCELAAIARDR